MYSRMTLNLSKTAKPRYETLEGKQYLVVPAVSLTEGVWQGSEGPLLYNKASLAKNPLAWNHKPVVVYHPTLNGEGISACEPAIIEHYRCGFIFNTAYDGRLKKELWIDEAKANQIDPRVVQSIQNGQTMEVSTGLYHEGDKTPGVFNGKPYNETVINMFPDHLAILPDEKGACSVADGAGTLRNAAAAGETSYEDIREQLRNLIRQTPYGYAYICDVFPKYCIFERDDKCYKQGYKLKSGKVTLDGEPEEVRKLTSYVTANTRVQIQHPVYVTMNGRVLVNDEEHQGPLRLPKPNVGELDEVKKRQQVEAALKEHYSGVQQEGDWGGWVTDLVANYVIWSKDGKHFRLPYTYDDDKISFDGEPEEVERVTEYRAKTQTPVDGTQSPYPKVSINMATRPTVANTIHQGAHHLVHDATAHMDAHHPPGGASDSQVRSLAGGGRKEQVNSMISGGHAREEDRSFLEGLPDDHFERVSKYVLKGATQPITPYTYEGVGDRSNAHGSGHLSLGHNQAPTVQNWLVGAPPEIQELIRNGQASLQREKQALIQRITSNRSNVFNPQYLATLGMDMLRGMSALCNTTPAQQTPPTLNYGGQADVPMFLDQQALTNNAQGQQQDDAVLAIPQWDFSANGK